MNIPFKSSAVIEQINVVHHKTFFYSCCSVCSVASSGVSGFLYKCLPKCCHLCLGVTVLLALTVFSLMVNDWLPRVSDAIPIIG